ncbi:CoA-binding protein [soil metagenome]
MAAACDIRLNTRLTEEQRLLFQNPKTVQDLLANAKTIAIVGLSTEKTKASNMVGSYLKDEGYTIIPIHPKATEILGEKAYPDLKSVPVHIDIVDIFRPPNEMPGIVAQAIEIGADSVWMQLKLANIEAAETARSAGLKVVADRCIKMEHGRYGGMLHWGGMNTEIISAKRRTLR